MGEHAVTTASDFDAGRFSPWPDEVRELGYQLWAFTCQRDTTRTTQALAERGHAVPDRTVRYWRDHDGWTERVSRELAAIAPAIRHETFGNLLLASLEGSRYLLQVARGEVPATRNDPRVAVAFGAIDRIGMAPTRDVTLTVATPQTVDHANDVASLTDEELLALEASLLEATRQR